MAVCVTGTCNVSGKILLCSSSKKTYKKCRQMLKKPSENDENMWLSYEGEKSDEAYPAL
jgi:hypothetical protein